MYSWLLAEYWLLITLGAQQQTRQQRAHSWQIIDTAYACLWNNNISAEFFHFVDSLKNGEVRDFVFFYRAQLLRLRNAPVSYVMHEYNGLEAYSVDR